MIKFLWICMGGAVGTGARYLISGWALKVFGSSFPYGTLTVNLVGSFLLAAIMHIGLNTEVFSPTVRLALTTGVLGGFTTYSTFNYETISYLEEGALALGALNIAVTVVSCLAASLLGFALARVLLGT